MTFALGSLDPLLVSRFEGFNRPQTVVLVTVLNSGTSENDQVLQQGSDPRDVADITGTIQTEADLATLRGYNVAKTPVDFVDGNGNTYSVVVLDLATTDHTDWWDFRATLLEYESVGS